MSQYGTTWVMVLANRGYLLLAQRIWKHAVEWASETFISISFWNLITFDWFYKPYNFIILNKLNKVSTCCLTMERNWHIVFCSATNYSFVCINCRSDAVSLNKQIIWLYYKKNKLNLLTSYSLIYFQRKDILLMFTFLLVFFLSNIIPFLLIINKHKNNDIPFIRRYLIWNERDANILGMLETFLNA